jgi:hypothetical protein
MSKAESQRLWNKPQEILALNGPDFSAQDLREKSYRGQNFQNANFENCDLRKADLRGCDLFAARFEGADLRGCKIEMNKVVEIRLPSHLPWQLVNQIRHFDFAQVMTRFVGPNSRSEKLPCPYAKASIKPMLYEWGSATWHWGANWQPPAESWTLEEIIAAVLDLLNCQHDLERAYDWQPKKAEFDLKVFA